MIDTKRTIDDLLGRYWEIAFSEGKTGVSRGDEANAVLHQIKGLTRIHSAEMPVEPAFITAKANYAAFVRDLRGDGFPASDGTPLLNYIEKLKFYALRKDAEAREQKGAADEIYKALCNCRERAESLSAENTKLKAENERLRKEANAKQAKIDELMLEYCPEDMTKEQLQEWGKHQVSDAALAAFKEQS